MTVSMNIKQVIVPTEYQGIKDINVIYDLMDLGTNEKIYTGTQSNSVEELIQILKTTKTKAGNFYIKNGLPVVLDNTFSITRMSNEEMDEIVSNYSEVNTDLEDYKPTVVNILTELSRLKSKLKFIPDYYNDKTGGASFENFVPDFTTVEMNASNLIISAKKFNIVLTATIRGMINIENGTAEIYRYHPFKLVKFGKLIHEELHVVIDEYNEPFLRRLNKFTHFGTNNEEPNIVKINLSDFPIFEEENINYSINNFLILLRAMRTIKSKNKAYNFYLKELRNNMDSDSILATKREWFHGEEVDDDYISDEGTEYLDVWEKGKKSIISISKLLDELGDFGKGLRDLVHQITTLETVDLDSIKDVTQMTVDLVLRLIKEGTLKGDEGVMLAVLSNALMIPGNKEERAKELIATIKRESITLNALELKFLTLRWNLYNSLTEKQLTKNNEVYKLGTLVKQTSDSVDLEAPQGTVVIKKGEVDSNYFRPSSSFNSNKDKPSKELNEEQRWKALLNSQQITEGIED